MCKLIYYIAIILSTVSGFLLLGLAGATDNGDPMQWIVPRAVVALVCMVVFAGVAHVAKPGKIEK